MKFGVREICNVVFRATQNVQIGNRIFKKGQPIFYLDSAKTSSVEGAATTVYAQGGRGNTRLIAWEGERTLTFTVEDALLSPVSFALLSGAGVVKGKDEEEVHFHQTSTVVADATTGIIDLTNALDRDESIDPTAPLYVMKLDDDGDLTGEIVEGDFNLVSESGTTSNAKLIYGTSTTSDFTTNNGGKYAYKYPGNINPEDRTKEDIQGWIDALNSNSPTTLAEPLPISLLAHPSKNAPTPHNPVTDSDNRTLNLSELWYVSQKARNISSNDGENYVLPLPNYFKNPVIKYSDIIFGNAAFASQPYHLNAEGTTAINDTLATEVEASGFYKIIGFSSSYGTNATWAQSVDDDYYSHTAANRYIKIKACSADGTITGNTEIVIRFLTRIKQAIINRYFGLTETPLQDANGNVINDKNKGQFKAYTLPASTSTALSYLNTALGVPGTTNENKAYEVANTQFAQAFSVSTAKRAFDAIVGNPLMIDYYVIKKSASVTELQIDAQNFAGYYYVEADTLFRRQIDGKDLPANLTFPNVKIQSNFTFTMASTGDPSTFTFTMDAFPGYTYFDKRKKVLCAIQIVDDKETKTSYNKTVFPHKTGVTLEASMNDSSPNIYDEYNDTVETVEINEG